MAQSVRGEDISMSRGAIKRNLRSLRPLSRSPGPLQILHGSNAGRHLLDHSFFYYDPALIANRRQKHDQALTVAQLSLYGAVQVFERAILNHDLFAFADIFSDLDEALFAHLRLNRFNDTVV